MEDSEMASWGAEGTVAFKLHPRLTPKWGIDPQAEQLFESNQGDE